MTDEVTKEELKQALSLLSKKELLDIVVGFMTVDMRTPITMFRSFRSTVEKVRNLLEGKVKQ